MTAMPLRAGTLAEGRTQVNLKCDACRHEWPIEMTPPVLIVTPDRETDGAPSDSPPPNAQAGHGGRGFSEVNQTDDRRDLYAMNRQRMRVGLCGLLMTADRTHTVTVLYSLDGHQATGRLRLLDPISPFPPWLVPKGRLRLSGIDGAPLRIYVTVVKLRRDGCTADEHFAEFVVRNVTQ